MDQSMPDLNDSWCLPPHPEKFEEKTSKRRARLLSKLNIFQNIYPTYCLPEDVDNMTEDQLELFYMKEIKRLQDEQKAKERDDFKEMMKYFLSMLMNMPKDAKSSSSDKPDFIVHHIIRFEK
jgi:hypothetical protein